MYSQKSPDTPEVVFADMEKVPIKAFWEKKGFIVSSFFSAVWLAFIYDYIVSAGWWETRYDLSPAEFVGHFCGLFLPIIVMFLVTAYFDRSAQLKDEANQLKSYLNELVYPTQEGADYTRSLTDALRLQIKEFRSVFSQLNKETQIVRDDLKQWIADLSKIIKHVDTKTISSVQEVAGHIQNLTEMTERANEQSEETTQLFLKQATILSQVTQEASDKINLVSGNLQNQTNDVQNLAHALEVANNRTNEALKTAEQVVKEMEKSSCHIEKAIEQYETDATQYNSRLFGNLEKVLSVFQQQGTLLENEVQKMTNRLGVLEDSLSGNAKGMLQVTNGVLNELSGIDTDFEKMIEKIQKTINLVKKDIQIIENSMEKSIQKATNVFPTARHQSQADLLQDATVILDRLQSFSVDMAHIFTPKSEDMLWKKYYDGDKAVFMRHITKMMTETQNKKIIDLYKKNEDFRLSVTRYMSEFEGMTKKAQEGEEGKLLMSVLIGSDVGRLYMVLADVLKKEA